METIKFQEFFNFFQNLISERYGLLESQLSNKLKFRFFNNSGEYFNYLDELTIYGAGNDDTVLINISDGGGVQDSSISIDTYLQIVSIEVMAKDKLREDLIYLFTDLVANYKTYTGTFNDAAYQLTIDEFPKYGDKFQALGDEYFNITFISNFIVIPHAIMSNRYTLTINGTNVKFNNITANRTTELKSDLKKRISQKFYPNTTGFQMSISGLFVDNDATRTIVSDCFNASNFNQYYNVQLKEGDAVIYNGSLFSKDINLVFAYGSIVSWSLILFEGAQI